MGSGDGRDGDCVGGGEKGGEHIEEVGENVKTIVNKLGEIVNYKREKIEEFVKEVRMKFV